MVLVTETISNKTKINLIITNNMIAIVKAPVIVIMISIMTKYEIAIFLVYLIHSIS